jgi:uncharacterized protein YeaO (DUF488 family)
MGGRMTSKRGKPGIQLKRVYEETSPQDGARFLVDGLWPRGIKKSALSDVEWVKEVAPSTKLRKWYGHEPEKWKEFQKRYRAELAKNTDAWKLLLDAAKKSAVMLLTSTHDVEISHAMVLRDFLKRKASG